jgi:hypothetical protein
VGLTLLRLDPIDPSEINLTSSSHVPFRNENGAKKNVPRSKGLFIFLNDHMTDIRLMDMVESSKQGKEILVS